jgi:hypothetical protein
MELDAVAARVEPVPVGMKLVSTEASPSTTKMPSAISAT